MAAPRSPKLAARAGFWRRALALLFDIVLIAFLSAIAGTLLFQLTGGRLRVSTTVIDTVSCQPLDPQQVALPSPPPFSVSNASLCTKRFFGVVHDRALRIENVKRSGDATYTRAVTYPVDADGHVVPAAYVDYVALIVFFVYVVLAEWRYGRTVGKRIVQIHVQSLGGGAISFAQAVKRSAIRFLPWPLFVLILTAPLLSSYDKFFTFVASTDAQAIMLIFFLAALLFIGNFVLATRRGTQPWHDRWAGTEVVPD
jgi:uncharacterized RDD family membrane protein YckC